MPLHTQQKRAAEANITALDEVKDSDCLNRFRAGLSYMILPHEFEDEESGKKKKNHVVLKLQFKHRTTRETAAVLLIPSHMVC